jgi:hypothetical protein
MNKELESRVLDIDPKVLDFLRQQPNVSSIDRNKNLLATGKVTYGQLERILHDMKYMDKKTDVVRYNLYGGQLMEDWGKSIIKQLRDTVRNTKAAKKSSDDMSGERKNPYNKSHSKKDNFSPSIKFNMIKANSEKSSTSSFAPPTLFEQIKRIKKLMI